MRCELRKWQTAALLAAALILGSCAGTDKNAWIELGSDPISAKPMIQITGMVVHSNLEGGLYLIRGADGTTYNPTNLPEALRIDGLSIEAAARRRNEGVSIGMVGSMVELVRIRACSDSTVSVAGTINYRERLALPSDAVLEVQLLDVSRQDVPATVVAATSFSINDRQVPIPFKLAYDPAKIVENHTYAVRAVIRSEGAMVFTTSSRYSVITRGNPSRADLMLERVGRTKARTERLWGTSWVLEDLAGVGVVDRVQATLVFSQDSAVNGNASCNQFRGTVTLTADSLSLTPLATTRKTCTEAVMYQETRYLEALRGADRFEVQGEFLYIHVAGWSQPLRFIGATSSRRATEAPAATKAVASSPDLIGIWTVVGHHIPAISAMSDADAKEWHRRTVRLTTKQANSPESHCDQPVYTTDSVNKDRFLGSQFNLPPGRPHASGYSGTHHRPPSLVRP